MEELLRDRLLSRVRTDLLGPGEEKEILPEKPSDRYLTGILYCQDEPIPEEENERTPEAADRDRSGGETSREEIGLHLGFRPSSMGLSFAVSGDTSSLNVEITAGRYVRRWKDEDGDLTETNLGKANERWIRKPVAHDAQIPVGELGFDSDRLDGTGTGQASPVLELSHQIEQLDPETRGVTVVLSNMARKGSGPVDALDLFQPKIRITARDGEFVARNSNEPVADTRDARINAVLYRNRASFASGHTCSAGWTEEEGTCVEIHSEWLPSSTVYHISHEGDRELAELTQEEPNLFRAEWLHRQDDPGPLCDELEKLPACYERWIERQGKAADGLDTDFLTGQAHRNLDRCRASAKRMRQGIELLRTNPTAFRSFRLAQGAMALQHKTTELVWRPFQLGFQLQSLASVGDRNHDKRDEMDLLWFPTGGGKTEAYLGLAAFALFQRRLRDETEDGDGGGVGVVTRYTLRLLTIQQFERSARMICACEGIRSGLLSSEVEAGDLGEEPFTIGFWAGTNATPNQRRRARIKPRQARLIDSCVWCGEQLPRPDTGEYRPKCENRQCVFGQTGEPLPVLTVDQDIYEMPPSMLIGTIDKFAQLVRKEETGRLFGVGTPHSVPDLVIQDELHLISGPLGTIAGLYETAIDVLCREQGTAPKVIGSTATIRGAGSQVRSLFNREVFQFPPPAIDAENSFFAVEDRSTSGRKYVGLTSAGRSPKHTLQGLSASLLQGAKGLIGEGADPEKVDPYWTLVAYFNSLRELGGALTLMEDDVRDSIKAIRKRREEAPRVPNPPTELTSRVASEEIPRILENLKVGIRDEHRPIDTVLATNMISVGMDVPRLGLMVVNGQPKTIAEYIQATSRVGRRDPGLIMTLFNARKTRDRSRYESFTSWHRTLYREVEASSVTPFAPRARDRALRSALIGLCRHLIDEMEKDPTLDAERRQKAEILASRIVQRARQIGTEAADEVEGELQQILDSWERRGKLDRYWATVPSNADGALLVGAEDRAAAGHSGNGHWTTGLWPALNSMREVEPGVEFRLDPLHREDS